jgi:hypothetical protein
VPNSPPEYSPDHSPPNSRKSKFARILIPWVDPLRCLAGLDPQLSVRVRCPRATVATIIYGRGGANQRAVIGIVTITTWVVTGFVD